MPINSFENYPMTWKPILPHRKAPLYKTLAALLEADIASGDLKPGDMLPPQRELADFLDLNLSTITRAFKLCEQKGLISAKTGKGTFVAADAHVSDQLLQLCTNETLIELGAAHPIYDTNHYILGAIKDLIATPDSTHFLQYLSPYGTSAQLAAATTWLQEIGVPASPNGVRFAAGGQNAIAASLSAFFRPGDRIGTDPLTYPGIKTAAKLFGIQLIPLPQENGELSTEKLRGYCKAENLKGLYLIPDYHNPTTHSLSEDKRREIAAIAKEYDLCILEDAINRLFAAAPIAPLAAFAPDHTVHILSLSKIFCAGMRIAFVALPERYRTALENALYAMNLMISPLLAEATCRMLRASRLEAIIAEKRSALAQRNAVADALLKDFDFSGDAYCNFRWLRLPGEWTGSAFETCAASAGVQIYCAERFSVGSAAVPNAVRICTTAPPTQDTLEKGLTILTALLHRDGRFLPANAWL